MFAPWRIPTFVSRPWRLIPELDRFSDEQCAQYATSLAPERFTGLILAAATALVVGVALALTASWFLEVRLEPVFPVLTERRGFFFRAVWLLTALLVIGTTLWLALTPYLLLIRRGLLRRLDLVRCPGCSYSLLGLRIESGTVICPECGRSVILEEQGLRAEDLLGGEATAGPSDARRGIGDRLLTIRVWVSLAVPIGLWLVFGWSWLIQVAVLAVVLVGVPLAQSPQGGSTQK